MSTVKLRRYSLAQGSLDTWVGFWRETVLPLRQAFGFEVSFAYLDHDRSEFVWALSFAGTQEEFEARDRDYYASSEWAAQISGRNDAVQGAAIGFVEAVELTPR